MSGGEEAISVFTVKEKLWFGLCLAILQSMVQWSSGWAITVYVSDYAYAFDRGGMTNRAIRPWIEGPDIYGTPALFLINIYAPLRC